MKISNKIPAKIKKILKIKPIVLEIKFETKTSRQTKGSKPLGYCQENLCQWENRVFKRKGIEKYLAPNFRKFKIAFESFLGNSTKCQKIYGKIVRIAIISLKV